MPVCFFFVFMETIGIEPPTSRGNSPQSGLSPRAVPQLAVTGPPDELFVATQHKTLATCTLPRALRRIDCTSKRMPTDWLGRCSRYSGSSPGVAPGWRIVRTGTVFR